MQYLTLYNAGILVLLALFTYIGYRVGRWSRDKEVERLRADREVALRLIKVWREDCRALRGKLGEKEASTK